MTDVLSWVSRTVGVESQMPHPMEFHCPVQILQHFAFQPVVYLDGHLTFHSMAQPAMVPAARYC